MNGILDLWGYKSDSNILQYVNGIPNTGTLEIMGYKIKVMILDEMNYEKRKHLIKKFLQL